MEKAYIFEMIENGASCYGYGNCDFQITKLSNGKGAILPAIPDKECDIGFRKSVEDILGPGWGGFLSLYGFGCKTPITKDMVTRIRHAHTKWTERFLGEHFASLYGSDALEELKASLKPRGFSLDYELEAVKNETTKICDLKITELTTGEEMLLSNNGGMDAAVHFEITLEKILGSEDAVVGLYHRSERPKVTRADADRIHTAYRSSLDH